jgi:sec-independent protein translocase protein TatA
MKLFILLEFISGGHIILIAFVLVLLFGGKKIPELMKGLGQGIHEFKKASSGDVENSTESKKEENK